MSRHDSLYIDVSPTTNEQERSGTIGIITYIIYTHSDIDHMQALNPSVSVYVHVIVISLAAN